MKNELQIVREIYGTKGIKGFYAGALPNYIRCLLKNSYKYPVMVGVPKALGKKINDDKVRKFFTGLVIALIEASITCPLERTKVYFMTQRDSTSYSKFFKAINQDRFNELFRGFTPLFMRQFLSWTLLLQTDFIVK